MKLIIAIFIFFGTLVFAPTLTPAQPSVPAFPGAEGFGAQTVGGRGGRVIEVTNLKNSGSGSFRAACEASGSRIVVFRVGGTIELDGRIEILNPFITIAGQTAPGGGICLKRRSGTSESFFKVGRGCHDVVIRYIRVRPGTVGGQPDGITIHGYNVIIDHCSVSWAVDENTATWYVNTKNVTFQWCIISEGLHCSTHPKGCHSMGLLIGGRSGKISLHHNLFAHNNERSPRMNTANVIDVVNNVIYNPGKSGSWGASHIGPITTRVNYIGNYFKPGPGSDQTEHYVSVDGEGSIFVQGNITPWRSSDNMDQVVGVVGVSDHGNVVSKRHDAPAVTTTPALEAYGLVLENVGATLPVRDAVDERVINDVKNGTGKIIDDPLEVGGWPKLASGTAPQDSDHDGMPNDWETANGLNPNDNSDGRKDRNGDGYTNVEEYINGLVPELVIPAFAISSIGQTGFNISAQLVGNGSRVTFIVALNRPGDFILEVYDIAGRILWEHRALNALIGKHPINWNPIEASSSEKNGVYLVYLKQNSLSVIRKFTLFQ